MSKYFTTNMFLERIWTKIFQSFWYAQTVLGVLLYADILVYYKTNRHI